VTFTSHSTYMLVCALLTGVVAAYWIVIDSVRLARALRDDRRQPEVRDRFFGSMIGLVVGAIGVFGALNYYYW
jgi:hypothetical protein